MKTKTQSDAITIQHTDARIDMLKYDITIDSNARDVYDRHRDQLYFAEDRHLKIQGKDKTKFASLMVGMRPSEGRWSLVCDNTDHFDLRSENWFWGTQSDVQVRASEGVKPNENRNSQKKWYASLKKAGFPPQQGWFMTRSDALKNRRKWEKEFCGFERVDDSSQQKFWEEEERSGITGEIVHFRYNEEEKILKVILRSSDKGLMAVNKWKNLSLASSVLGRFIPEIYLTPSSIKTNEHSESFKGLLLRYDLMRNGKYLNPSNLQLAHGKLKDAV